MKPRYFESDEIAHAVQRHIRRHGKPGRAFGDFHHFVSFWNKRRRSPRQVWHAASVHEWNHAVHLVHVLGDARARHQARLALAAAHQARQQGMRSPLPGLPLSLPAL